MNLKEKRVSCHECAIVNQHTTLKIVRIIPGNRWWLTVDEQTICIKICIDICPFCGDKLNQDGDQSYRLHHI